MNGPIRSRIEIVDGDITTQKVDAVFNAANTALTMESGVAAAIKKAAGVVLAQECEQRGPIPLGSAAVTRSGDLAARWVVHAASMEPGGKATEESLVEAVRAAFEKADNLGCRTVALPAIGAGAAGLPMKQVAELLIGEAALALHVGRRIDQVRFVLFGEEANATFSEVLEKGDLVEAAERIAVDLSKSRIRDVPDFPKPGIMFKDITPLLADHWAMRAVSWQLAEAFADAGIAKVMGIEARGFIFGTLVAQELGCGLVPVRKQGKLPAATESYTYDLEYGTDTVEIHADALRTGERILIVDDVLATGGTAGAVCSLARKLGAEVAGCAFLIELGFLDGRKKLGDVRVESLITY